MTKSTDVTPVLATSRGDRFHNTEQEMVISQDLLSFTNKASSRSLSKDKWKELTTSHTQIKTMEAGMNEELIKVLCEETRVANKRIKIFFWIIFNIIENRIIG